MTIKDCVGLKITGLYKQFLYLIEDMVREHDSSFQKLKDSIPDSESNINHADWLTDERLIAIRKRVLDLGNDTIRSLESVLSAIDAEIVLKVNKNEAKDSIRV